MVAQEWVADALLGVFEEMAQEWVADALLGVFERRYPCVEPARSLLLLAESSKVKASTVKCQVD
jgi:hypothetical protein